MSNRISDAMRKAMTRHLCPMEDEDAEPIRTVSVKFVRCVKCGVAVQKTTFDFNGASLRGCQCKPGEEEWRIVIKEVPEGGDPRQVTPPARR